MEDIGCSQAVKSHMGISGMCFFVDSWRTFVV